MSIPPTSRLPPIRNIDSHSYEDLHDAIAYIQTVYNPPVRGTRRKSKHENAIHNLNLDLELLQDSFERAYVIKWLTALIVYLSLDDSKNPSAEDLLREVSALLAVCAGTASAGIITRTLFFDSPTGQISVHLRDVPLNNDDYRSVGAQTWGGACVMAEMIAEHPDRFGIIPTQTPKVLELGAGTGLVSLVIGKLAQQLEIKCMKIVATDHYPSVLQNLKVNIDSNNFTSSVLLIEHHLDWSLPPDTLTLIHGSPLDQRFDVVFGADIVYELQHAIWIKSCLTQLLQKPSPSRDPTFHLIIPLRSTHTFESSTIDKVFGDSSEGNIFDIRSKEIIMCDGERDEVEYAYYRIGWCRLDHKKSER